MTTFVTKPYLGSMLREKISPSQSQTRFTRVIDLTYKAYIDNIKAKTGKDPEYYLALAKKKGLTKHSELLAWLKTETGLGHGHASAIVFYIRDPDWAKKKIREDAKKEKAKK